MICSRALEPGNDFGYFFYELLNGNIKTFR